MWRVLSDLWQKTKAWLSERKVAKAVLKALPAPSKNADVPPPRQEQDHACPAYMELKLKYRDIGRLAAIGETLGRDFLTAMPSGAYESRLGQIAFLFRRMHEDLTDEKVQQLLDEARAHEYVHPAAWDSWDRANLREMEALYRRHCHIGGELMEQKARLEYVGRRRHQELLEQGSWEAAKPFLQEQIDLSKSVAAAQCEAGEYESAYDALMQNYCPDMKLSEVSNLLEDYHAEIKALMPHILEAQAGRSEPKPLSGHYPAESQMWLNRSLLKTLSFDFDRGGLYETGHNPVEGGTPDDTRLVIKIANSANFLSSMKSALHEGGHGLYIQGLPRKTWRYQPVGQDLGAAMHESQALLVDMMIGRSRAFFRYLAPRVEGLFHELGHPELSAENLYKLRTHVKPTPIRRHADEVTYFGHVLLRFRVEKAIFDGEATLNDLPELWSRTMEDLVGVRPANDAEGILQDVHWFVGKFGYFPAYALGHMMAAQLYEAMEDQLGDLEGDILEGDFSRVKTWLNEHIHIKGRLMNAPDLIRKVTGRPLDPDALIRHIKQRYL